MSTPKLKLLTVRVSDIPGNILLSFNRALRPLEVLGLKQIIIELLDPKTEVKEVKDGSEQ